MQLVSELKGKTPHESRDKSYAIKQRRRFIQAIEAGKATVQFAYLCLQQVREPQKH